MDIVGAEGSVVDASGSGSGLAMALHPLVILQISDHFTRQKGRGGGADKRVMGCILGIPEFRRTEIHESFEVPYAEGEDGTPVPDINFLTVKAEQMRKVFPNYEVLGWYSTGHGAPQKADLEIQKSLIHGTYGGGGDAEPICERPLFLMLDTRGVAGKELPIAAYESELRADVGDYVFVPVEAYNLKPESGEAERISVDHIAQAASKGGAGASALTNSLGGMKNAVTMLSERIAFLQRYLADVQGGKLEPNPSVLRELSSLCSRLPITKPPDFFTDYNDTLLVTYLSSMTKCANSSSELLEKFGVVQQANGGAGGMLGGGPARKRGMMMGGGMMMPRGGMMGMGDFGHQGGGMYGM